MNKTELVEKIAAGAGLSRVTRLLSLVSVHSA